MMRIFFVFSFYLFLLWPSLAQTVTSQDSLKTKYAFLNLEQNVILNDTVGLKRFYKKLLGLRMRLVPTVSVVHIGDSHLQADVFPGRVRRELQQAFGNAGRGLVFPYKVARTNGPWDYRTTSAQAWRSRRVISARDSLLEIGVAGITLATQDPGASLVLQITPNQLLDYRFNKAQVLRRGGPQAFDLEITDAAGKPLGVVPGQGSYLSTVLRTDSLLTGLQLRVRQQDSAQLQTELYGLVLENGQPGVLYHMIGINGAAYRHYNKAPLFTEQLQVLSPDLFILSLGTNDAYGAGFDEMAFYNELHTLVSRLRQQYPRAEVLLTTPGDSYRHRKYRNPDLKTVRDLMKRYCLENGLACWDFHSVMGGYGAMQRWQAAGLAQPDRVHLTSAGYQLQGFLLYTALTNGFEKFAPTGLE